MITASPTLVVALTLGLLAGLGKAQRDEAGPMYLLARSEITGPVNVVTPNPVTNREFAAASPVRSSARRCYPSPVSSSARCLETLPRR
ncbi:MAG TPA: hypothetical protein VIV15_06260 [Anaerolineales bacterium]